MGENTHLIQALVTRPSQSIALLKDKTTRLFKILILPSAILFGFNYSVSHFQVNITQPLFWYLVLGVGLLFIISIALFLATYYGLARGMKERDSAPVIKVMGYDYLLLFTLFNIIELGPTLVLYLASLNYLSVALYDLCHISLLLWIGALGVQALQTLRKESEFRSCLKIFAALFVMYGISTLVYLLVSASVMNLIIR